MKQGTSLVKNSSQTVEIKDKTNQKKPYLQQNTSNHKLDGSNLHHSIKIFNNLLSKGPIYMCSLCQQTQIYMTTFCDLWGLWRKITKIQVDILSRENPGYANV